jgi:serine/threonine protein kinase
LHGRHGDLKPENILWFPQDESISKNGVLKITDFGISRFSKEDSKEGHVSHSPTYRSPEYAVSKVYGPACDVWALGCIFLEFATWFCGGYYAVEKFSKSRLAPDEETAPIDSDAFFLMIHEEDKKTAEVKPCVISVRPAFNCIVFH